MFPDPESHKKHIETALESLKKAGACTNFQKSKFNTKKVKYLGYVISEDGIQPDITRILNFIIPKIDTKRKLQKIIGLINWSYVKNISIKLHKIYEKLKNEKFTPLESQEINLIEEIFK